MNRYHDGPPLPASSCLTFCSQTRVAMRFRTPKRRLSGQHLLAVKWFESGAERSFGPLLDRFWPLRHVRQPSGGCVSACVASLAAVGRAEEAVGSLFEAIGMRLGRLAALGGRRGLKGEGPLI